MYKWADVWGFVPVFFFGVFGLCEKLVVRLGDEEIAEPVWSVEVAKAITDSSVQTGPGV
jgi:hypothetical protein